MLLCCSASLTHAVPTTGPGGGRKGPWGMAELTELAAVMHEEHFRMLVLICGLETRVTGASDKGPIDPQCAEDRLLLEELVSGLDEMVHHNVFEETVLFPLIRNKGASDLASLLTQEHYVIGPLAKRLRLVAGEVLEHGMSPVRWINFREASRVCISQLVQHLQKEEHDIVQRLATLLDPAVDHQLALQCVSDSHADPLEKRAGKAA